MTSSTSTTDTGTSRGDEILAHVASMLRGFSRDIEAPARYGGEELPVLLADIDLSGATQAAERMRAAVERMREPGVGGRGPCA